MSSQPEVQQSPKAPDTPSTPYSDSVTNEPWYTGQEDDEEDIAEFDDMIASAGRSTNNNATARSMKLSISLKDIVNRVRFSRLFSLFYIVMIILGLFLLIWTFVKSGHPREVWFIALEGVLTFLLALEVATRMFLEGKHFFGSLLNWVDVLVTLLCILSFSFYAITRSNSTKVSVDEVLDTLLMILRYAAAFLRLCSFVTLQRRHRPLTQSFIDLQSGSSNIMRVASNYNGYIEMDQNDSDDNISISVISSSGSGSGSGRSRSRSSGSGIGATTTKGSSSSSNSSSHHDENGNAGNNGAATTTTNNNYYYDNGNDNIYDDYFGYDDGADYDDTMAMDIVIAGVGAGAAGTGSSGGGDRNNNNHNHNHNHNHDKTQSALAAAAQRFSVLLLPLTPPLSPLTLSSKQKSAITGKQQTNKTAASAPMMYHGESETDSDPESL